MQRALSIRAMVTLTLGSGYMNGNASISCFVNVRFGQVVLKRMAVASVEDQEHGLMCERL